MDEATAEAQAAEAQRLLQQDFDAPGCVQLLERIADGCRRSEGGPGWPVYVEALERLVLTRALLLSEKGPLIEALLAASRRASAMHGEDVRRRNQLRHAVVYLATDNLQGLERQWQALLLRRRKGSDGLRADADLLSRLCRDMANLGFLDETRHLLDFGLCVCAGDDPVALVNLLESLAAAWVPTALANLELGPASPMRLSAVPELEPPAPELLRLAGDALLKADELRLRCAEAPGFFYPGGLIQQCCRLGLQILEHPGAAGGAINTLRALTGQGFSTWRAVFSVGLAAHDIDSGAAELVLRRLERDRPHLGAGGAVFLQLQRCRALVALRRTDDALQAHRAYAQAFIDRGRKLQPIRARLHEMVLRVIESRSRVHVLPGSPPTGARRSVVDRAMDIMQARIRKPLRIKLLADELALSQRTLEEAFRIELGQSPAAYFQALRLAAVKACLESAGQPHVSLKRLAFEFGFRSYPAFSRAYSQRFGSSPSAAGGVQRRLVSRRRAAPPADGPSGTASAVNFQNGRSR